MVDWFLVVSMPSTSTIMDRCQRGKELKNEISDETESY